MENLEANEGPAGEKLSLADEKIAEKMVDEFVECHRFLQAYFIKKGYNMVSTTLAMGVMLRQAEEAGVKTDWKAVDWLHSKATRKNV